MLPAQHTRGPEGDTAEHDESHGDEEHESGGGVRLGREEVVNPAKMGGAAVPLASERPRVGCTETRENERGG